MYHIKNFLDNGSVKTLDRKGPFRVIEYQREACISPETAEHAFFCSKMNVHRRQLVCSLWQGPVILQPGAMQWTLGDVTVAAKMRTLTDYFKQAVRGRQVVEDSTLKPVYTGSGMLVLEPTYRQLILLDTVEWGNAIVVDEGMFRACDARMEQTSTARANADDKHPEIKLANLKLVGSGIVCLELDYPPEDLIYIDLQDDTLKVDGNFAVAWSTSLEVKVEAHGKSALDTAVSGEGLVNVFHGSGKILMMPTANPNLIARSL